MTQVRRRIVEVIFGAQWQSTADLGALPTLVSTAAIGSITYPAALWKLDERSVRRILQWLGPHRLAGGE